jgi:hypothetical protein
MRRGCSARSSSPAFRRSLSASRLVRLLAPRHLPLDLRYLLARFSKFLEIRLLGILITGEANARTGRASSSLVAGNLMYLRN